MNRVNLENGVNISEFSVDKFKRSRVSLYFTWPSTRKSATAEALLPFLMERSYADCPDMSELSKRLAALYGASLSVDLINVGANKVLSVCVTGIQDEYALNDEKLSLEYADMALNVAFRPYLTNGVFNEKNVEIEKEQLYEQLLSEINEKRGYCIRQARRKFYKDAPEGIEKNGYLEEVKELSAKQVTDAWKKIIKTAQIEVMVFGADAKIISLHVLQYLSKIKREPAQIKPANAMPYVDAQNFKEEMQTEQSKLCMMFTMQNPARGREHVVLRVASALLGGTATSRLHTNVREKMSLCYYCSSFCEARNGTLYIDSGIEHENTQNARDAILNELDKLINGEITNEELSETIKSITQRLKSVQDMLGGLESWYFSEVLRGEQIKTPSQLIKEIETVKPYEIKQLLAKFSLSVEYLITKGSEA